MIPSPTMILGVLLAVVIAWGSAATYYAKTLVESRAEVQAALQEANNQTKEQIKINGELRADVKAEQRALSMLGKERTNDQIRFQKELSRINEQRVRAERIAIENPERYGVVATYDLLRGMRDVCRRGGGAKDDCKISPVQAPAPRADHPGNSQSGNAGNLESP